MEQWFVVDTTGFVVSAVFSDAIVQLDEGFRVVTKPWPNGMRKPRHDEATDEWISGETPEEKAAREALENAPKPPTTAEEVANLKTENAELKRRLAEKSDIIAATSDNLTALMEYVMTLPAPVA